MVDDLQPTTPAARWREKGEEDPHGKRYDCERARLCGGHLYDDEVACQLAMLMPGALNHEAVLLTGKDRIRWLSRRFAEAARIAASANHALAIEDLGEALFHLSDKLRGSGFLTDAANAAEYERVVAAFAKLETPVARTAAGV